MGVRGLTTFIANRSRKYLERYELHDCYLVIDGNSLASQLYKWHCKCNDCFGGDYDKYRNVVTNFFQLLSDCNITPLVIFDGAYEKRKLKTVYSRMRSKLAVIKQLSSVTEGQVSLFPLFMRDLFLDILLNLEVKCVRCDFEADSEAAHLAKCLRCPLLSYDSDFYIFDVLYIPFSTMELRLHKKTNVNYIVCEMYRVDKFLNSFGGLDKIHLPLLSAMLGNDYIKQRSFAVFYRQLGVYKSKQREHQIKTVIMWLKNETPDSALRKILGRYKLCNRKQLAKEINRAIKGYQAGDSQICSFFNLDVVEPVNDAITVPDPETVEDIDNDECAPVGDDDSSEASEDQEEQEEDEEKQEEEEEEPGDVPRLKFTIPNFFRDNFRKCLYPPCFMDMLTAHTCYCIPQVEDYASEHSHKVAFQILAAIHKILTFPNKRRLTCVSRSGSTNIKKFHLPVYKKTVTKLEEIQFMDTRTSRQHFFNILNLQDDSELFQMFPDHWHLYLISLKYWVTNCEGEVEVSHVYSLLLCAIVLQFVDPKIGFYRSTRSFSAKYNKVLVTNVPSPVENITDALDAIDLNNSVACMKNLIDYFQMDAKMKTNLRLFDRSIVHAFAQFQSCVQHVKFLNCLLNRPMATLLVSDFYDGTFLYNMTANLVKRTDLKGYIRILMNGCPRILATLELMMGVIECELDENLAKHEPPKKRRKRRKKSEKEEEVVVEVDDTANDSEEEYFDESNVFSLLSSVNK